MGPLDDAPELCRMGVAELTRRYADFSLSPVEVTETTLDRVVAIQPRFNAFRFLDLEGARAAAAESEARWRAGTPLSPIDGVPTTIKDLVWVKGWTVRYGTRAVPGIAAEEDAPAVALLRAAGAVLIGLTNTPEFGWKAVTDCTLTGITRNPWNPERTSGGSSGGAAVAAAVGAGVLHLGTDGGGSIRIPSSFCGVVGHKPTFGRVPAYPSSPFGTVAHIGPIARSVADAALMLDVMSGRDLRDWHQSPYKMPPVAPVMARPLAGLRIAVWETPPRSVVAPDVRAAFARVLDRLSDAGAVAEPITLPGGDVWELFRLHWHSGAAARLASVPEDRHGELEAGLREVAADGARLSAVELIAAQTWRSQFGAALEQMLAGYDVMLSPAVAVTAFAAGAEVPPGSGLSRWTDWAGFSYPINLAQLPACVVPGGVGADGMPAGVQVVGRRGEDAAVMGVADMIGRLL